MDPDLGGLFDLTMFIVVGSLVATIGTTLLIIGAIVWVIRRASPPHQDPAVAELKRRLASGEISPVEYEVRMRALQDDD